MKASKLKIARVERGLKVKEVSASIGIAPCYLSMIEGRNKPVTQEILIKLAGLYDMNPNSLID